MATAKETGCDYRRLLACFVRLDLRAKYVGSIMGWVWTVFQPLFMLAVYTFVFSMVFHIEVAAETGTSYYALFLFCGLLPWHAFQRGVMRSTGSLVENANLIKKVAFPVNIVPVYLSVSELISELVGFALLLGAIVLFDPPLHLTVLLLPLVLAVQLLFTLGVGWIAACGNAYFRDVYQFMGLLMMAWFFGTPILYPLEKVPAGLRTLLGINPMAHLMEIYRAILLRGELPAAGSVAIFCGFAVVVFVGGWAVFRRNEKAIADFL